MAGSIRVRPRQPSTASRGFPMTEYRSTSGQNSTTTNQLFRRLSPSPAGGDPPRLLPGHVTFRPMTEPDARQIVTWRYPPPYDFYDVPEEAWPDLLGLGDRFLAADLPVGVNGAPRRSGFRSRLPRLLRLGASDATSAVTGRSVLGGFVCFGHEAQVSGARNAGLYRDAALDIGLGLRPNLTGHGFGAPFLAACLALAALREPHQPLRLAVATFNERAITTYRRAGFQDAGTCQSPVRGRDFPFLVMTRPPTVPAAGE